MRTAAPPPISEKAFQQQVTGLAAILGWLTYHPWLSIHSPRGFPDLALCRPPRLILAELKTQKGKVSPSQERWAELLSACPGVEYYLWRPADIDEVAAILQSKVRPDGRMTGLFPEAEKPCPGCGMIGGDHLRVEHDGSHVAGGSR